MQTSPSDFPCSLIFTGGASGNMVKSHTSEWTGQRQPVTCMHFISMHWMTVAYIGYMEHTPLSCGQFYMNSHLLTALYRHVPKLVYCLFNIRGRPLMIWGGGGNEFFFPGTPSVKIFFFKEAPQIFSSLKRTFQKKNFLGGFPKFFFSQRGTPKIFFLI